ncbi:MAG: flagellar basal body rod protein FlgC [Buchnera aphidicola (Nurudea shiraii)]
MSLLKIFDISNSAMNVQSQKMQIHASNIANIDSLVNKNGKLYPYIAKKIVLKYGNINDSEFENVKVEKIIEDKTPLKKIYNPNSPIADPQGFSEISNVNLVTETIDFISASRNYQTNLELLNTAKAMIIKTLTIGQ